MTTTSKTPLTDEFFGENCGTGQLRDSRNHCRAIEERLNKCREVLEEIQKWDGRLRNWPREAITQAIADAMKPLT